MIHLQKGMSNALTKSGGIKSGVWMSLRSVSIVSHAYLKTQNWLQ